MDEIHESVGLVRHTMLYSCIYILPNDMENANHVTTSILVACNVFVDSDTVTAFVCYRRTQLLEKSFDSIFKGHYFE